MIKFKGIGCEKSKARNKIKGNKLRRCSKWNLFEAKGNAGGKIRKKQQAYFIKCNDRRSCSTQREPSWDYSNAQQW